MNRLSTAVATVLPGSLTCQRSDVQRRAIVDRAIAMQTDSNTVSAVEYLKAHGIEARLIERVLLEPQRRRPVPHRAPAGVPWSSVTAH